MTRNLFGAVLVMTFFSSVILSFGESPPNHIDLSKFPATQLDDIVVPLPSEVFNVLDKLGSPNWQEQLREPNIKNRGEREQIALLLGSVVAEGFVAVEAADKARVKQIGRDVLLNRHLGRVGNRARPEPVDHVATGRKQELLEVPLHVTCLAAAVGRLGQLGV